MVRGIQPCHPLLHVAQPPPAVALLSIETLTPVPRRVVPAVPLLQSNQSVSFLLMNKYQSPFCSLSLVIRPIQKQHGGHDPPWHLSSGGFHPVIPPLLEIN